jgi:hypothetical protein
MRQLEVVLTEVPSSEPLKYPPVFNRKSEHNLDPIPTDEWD